MATIAFVLVNWAVTSAAYFDHTLQYEAWELLTQWNIQLHMIWEFFKPENFLHCETYNYTWFENFWSPRIFDPVKHTITLALCQWHVLTPLPHPINRVIVYRGCFGKRQFLIKEPSPHQQSGFVLFEANPSLKFALHFGCDKTSLGLSPPLVSAWSKKNFQLQINDFAVWKHHKGSLTCYTYLHEEGYLYKLKFCCLKHQRYIWSWPGWGTK